MTNEKFRTRLFAHPQFVNISSIVYFFVVSLIAHSLELPTIAFLIILIPLLFVRCDFSLILAFYFINSLAFYDPSDITSRVSNFLIPDIILLFLIFVVIVKKPDPFEIKIPINSLLITLYLMIFYFIAMSIKPLFVMGKDFYVMADIREVCLFLLVPFIAFHKNFSLKSGFRLIIIIILSTTFCALNCIITYLLTNDRVLTWHETFFADALLMSIILFFYLKSIKIKIILGTVAVICFFAMIFTQTRSIWLASAICGVLIVPLQLLKGFKWSSVLKFIKIISFVVILLISVEGIFKVGLVNLVTNRFKDFSMYELINPASSTGYRVYESYMVLRSSTLWGHGSGARIHLVKTQGKKIKWHYWWSIHCEYFEILHKYGYVGLGIFLIFLAIYFCRASLLIVHSKKVIRIIGLICFIVMLQHCIISITSGYIIRDDITSFLAFMICLLEVGWLMRKNYRFKRNSKKEYINNVQFNPFYNNCKL